MKNIFFSLLIILILSISIYLFYDFKINHAKKEDLKFASIEDLSQKKYYNKTLSPNDLDPKSFIKLLSEKYNKDSPFNFVTMAGDFPDEWVKLKDVPYLISILHSKEKCCGYMNIFSSHMPSENGEVGGFAIIFLNSYISKTKINLGLNCNPKTDATSIKKIETWYSKLIK